MKDKKDLSVINCFATAFLAYFFTLPVHELFHALTHLVYGNKVTCFSAGAVASEDLIDYSSLSYFHRIMVAGGSACILNIIIGIILMVIVFKVSMGPVMRVFMIQLMGAQLSEGIGYFMIGGFFGAGDWGNVFSCFPDDPGFVTALRIVLSIIGSLGFMGIFFLLSYTSYYFIKDRTDLKERNRVGFKLHLTVLITGFTVGMIITALSPYEGLSLLIGLLYNMMWISFFWGFMFTGVMKEFIPQKSRFLYELSGKPRPVLIAAAAVLILINIFVFGPGIYFN